MQVSLAPTFCACALVLVSVHSVILSVYLLGFTTHKEVHCDTRINILDAMPEFSSRRIIIVGSGLAGLAAALEISTITAGQRNDIEIVILDKEVQPGGNSMKASSGMNSLNKEAHDTPVLFEADTTTSGGGLSVPELVSTIVNNSEAALQFLSALGANLTKVCQLGGHSVPRTWSNPTGPNVGVLIIKSALAAIKHQANVHLMCGSKVQNVVMQQGQVIAVDVEREDAVILATGGFAASKTLLMEHNQEAAGFATTNGKWATGDGIQLGAAVGAQLVDMDQVQVHPTGFVDRKDPANQFKILAPERLRGVGAILLNTFGERFVDELQRRDTVTNAMKHQPGQVALILLGSKSAMEYGLASLEFYKSKGLMLQVENAEAAAHAMGVPWERLHEQLQLYNHACEHGKDLFGKTTFPAEISATDPIWLGTVTPVVHYTMGGLAINTAAQVLSAETRNPIPGLFAAGEATGGLHGKNRLAGNSLLECVVFGRIAGRNALLRIQQDMS